MSVTVSTNTVSARDELAKLEQFAPKAVARALNRGILAARTLMVRNVARDMGLRVGDVREQVRVYEAHPKASGDQAELTARLETGLVRLPLIDFRAKGPEPSRGKGKGVSWRIGPTAKRDPQAFIATMRSGHRGVFKRESKARLGIFELFGPSLGHVFIKYEPEARERGIEQFSKTLASELKFRKAGA